MPRSTCALSIAVVVVAACAQPSQSTAVTAPTSSPSPVASAAPVPSAAPLASAPAESLADAAAPSVPEGGPAEVASSGAPDAGAGAPAQFRACSLDSDCVAVDRVGCCHNGWKEAVAASQKDAYAKSFTCPPPRPMCPMYIVQDGRMPECDNATHLCTMVRPEDIACMGFIKNKHACPPGYHCQLPKPGDFPGKCIKP